MRAMICTQYGPPDVLRLQEVEKPAPKDHEVLIRNHATSVNYGDLTARNFKEISPREFNMPFLFWLIAKVSFGLEKPNITILGSEFAGEIEAVGKDVHKFKPGDPVFASTFAVNFGGYAEYKCLPENGVLALKPANLNYQEAAAIPGAGQT